MNPKEFQDCYQQLLDRSNKGGRFAYWNMLVPVLPFVFEASAFAIMINSQDIHFQDKAWFYQAFVVDEVIG